MRVYIYIYNSIKYSVRFRGAFRIGIIRLFIIRDSKGDSYLGFL